MNQVIEKLRSTAKLNGYITFDDISHLSEKENLSLVKTEKVIGQLLDEGYLILEDKPSFEHGEVPENTEYDKSHIDYEKIFSEVIQIEPGLKNYINRVRKIPAPRPGEEAELIGRAKNKNKYARKRLILMFLKIVVRQALYFHNRTGYPLDDAIQEGNIGLIKAIRKFEIKPGHRFSTYAPWWIRQKMERAYGDNSRTIRLPIHMHEQVITINKIQNDYFNKEGKSPTILEVILKSDYLSETVNRKISISNSNGLPPKLSKAEEKEVNKAITKIKSIIRYSKPILSLDESMKNSEKSLSDIIPDTKVYSVDQELLSKLFVEFIFDNLSDREIKVLKLRYGFIEDEIHTLEQIGEMEGVTRERIRQIESNALKKIEGKIIRSKVNISDWI